MPLTPAEATEARRIADILDARTKYKFRRYFPDTGELRRELYPRSLLFFEAGLTNKERLFLAANRTSKTVSAAYEVYGHVSGQYPAWWMGRRFETPIQCWAAGDTRETTRDIVQLELFGEREEVRNGTYLTGMVEPHRIVDRTLKTGVADCIDTAWIRWGEDKHHGAPVTSTIQFKCHPAGTRVLLADGSWAAIEAVRLGDVVRCPDGAARPVVQLHAYRDAPVLNIVTRSGSVQATPNHPFFVVGKGAVLADSLRVGDALVEAFHEPDACVPQERWRVCLTALMIGDGCARGKTPFFTCNDPAIVDMVRDVLPPDLSVVPIANTISFKLSSSLHKCNRLRDSLVADGLWGKKAHGKFLPEWVFRLPIEQRVEFVRWLWGCDGSLTAQDAVYSTVSDRLANDLRLLLIGLGIRVRVSEHTVTCNGKPFRAFYLGLHGHNRLAFSAIGKLGRSVTTALKPRPRGPAGEVLSIEPRGTADVFCVGVDGVHELIVEGFAVGNSYDQGRVAFQGTSKHLIWLDEEPPDAAETPAGGGTPSGNGDIYTECLLRTATTDGLIIATFTPLRGLTPFVDHFLETGTMADQNGALVNGKLAMFGADEPRAEG